MRRLIDYYWVNLRDLDSSIPMLGFAGNIWLSKDPKYVTLNNAGRIRWNYLCVRLLLWSKVLTVEIKLSKVNEAKEAEKKRLEREKIKAGFRRVDK